MVLDRAHQVLGLDGAQLDQDRAQAPAGRDQLAGLEVLADRDLAAQQQALAEPLVRVAAARVHDPAHVQVNGLRDVALAERQDAGLAAPEDGPDQLRDARVLDLAPEDEALVLPGRPARLAHAARPSAPSCP